jgi:hypothetical protein
MERRHLVSVVVSECIQFKSGRLVYMGLYIFSPQTQVDDQVVQVEHRLKYFEILAC